MLLTGRHHGHTSPDPRPDRHGAIALVDQAIARSATLGSASVPIGDVYDLLLDLRRALGQVDELEADLDETDLDETGIRTAGAARSG